MNRRFPNTEPQNIEHRFPPLTFKVGGETKTVFVPPDRVGDVERWAREYKRLKRLIRAVPRAPMPGPPRKDGAAAPDPLDGPPVTLPHGRGRRIIRRVNDPDCHGMRLSAEDAAVQPLLRRTRRICAALPHALATTVPTADRRHRLRHPLFPNRCVKQTPCCVPHSDVVN